MGMGTKLSRLAAHFPELMVGGDPKEWYRVLPANEPSLLIGILRRPG
jgi:hypothetical protein